MPDEPRRIVLEKSRTVRRRYQRSNKGFQFTPSQLARIKREQERENRAKQLREKEKKRVANKKRKADQEAHDREERKRRGLPDPHAPPVPASQPLLSKFLGLTTRQSSVDTGPTTTETDSAGDGGDTEADSDTFDDCDEALVPELAELQDAGVLEQNKTYEPGEETRRGHQDDDEFSECSAFNDEDIIKEAEAAAIARPTDKQPISNASQQQQQQHSMPGPPKALIASFGDSFRDETAAFLEEAFSHGRGDPFGELIGMPLDPKPR